MRKVLMEEKSKTFCSDCPEEPEKCGWNPIDCMNQPESRIYFELYESTGRRIKNV